MSLENASATLRTSLLDLLWAQWTDLGVAGTRGSGRTILDPEAVLMATLDVGRFDPRLFDEVLDWLVHNGSMLDVTRLRRLMRNATPEQQRLARVVIDFMRDRDSGSKWTALSDQWEANESTAVYSPQSLFLGADGIGLPVFGQTDPFFASYGFMRAPIDLRGMSGQPRVDHPSLARLAARALAGNSVRAEVLLYLWTHESGHGRLISIRADYSQRQVSEYLAGLSTAGFAERIEHGKTVQYRLVRALRWGPATQARYVDWARAYSALTRLRADLHNAAAEDDSYEASVLARAALERVLAALPIEGLSIPAPKPQSFPGTSVLEHAQEIALAVVGAVTELGSTG